MKILAADTALGACSVAVLDGGKILSHKFVAMERGHAEALAPMVDETMRESGVAFSALDRLAVTTGPGTFTGQRVGLAFMRGLRVALKKPLIGVTTLQAMGAAALGESGCDFAASIHDARRNECYLAVMSKHRVLVEPVLVSLDDAASLIAKAASGEIALAGTAAERMASDLLALGRKSVLTSIRQPDALWVARIAAKAEPSDTAPSPLYLRAPDAKLPAANP